jgi:hypothetical protein
MWIASASPPGRGIEEYIVGLNQVLDVAVHVPQQQFGVEVLVAELANPANAPGTECHDDRLELSPSRCQHSKHVTSC